MAKKKVSETIAQQRKAQQDFLELKKMQHGEMDTGPKPSEVAIMPQTFTEKVQNYWFHFKWHTLGTIFAVISLVILISQCSARTDWDLQVVYFTYTPVIDQQTEALADYLETVSKDLNGDGEVNIQVVNCSISTDNINAQYNKTVLSKLQSLIAAEEKALLYITDSESEKYFEADAIKNFFETEPVKLSEKVYTESESEEFGPLPQGLQIACRRVENSFIEKNKNVEEIYKESLSIIEKIKE